MQRTLLLLLITPISFLVSHNASMAMGNKCVSLLPSAPTIQVIDAKNEIAYHYDVSKKKLAHIKDRHEQQYAELILSGSTLGLTLGSYSYNLQIISGFKPASFWGGGYCPNIKQVILNFNYNSEIYIAKEYTKNKCAFEKIMAHEMEHHKVNTKNKHKYLSWLKTDLPAIVNAISQKHAQSVPRNAAQSVNDQIQGEIEDAIDAYFYKMHLDTKIQNQKLDTTSEYLKFSRTLKKCFKKKRGW